MFAEELNTFRRLGIRYVLRFKGQNALILTPFLLGSLASPELRIGPWFGADDVEGLGFGHKHRVADRRGSKVRLIFTYCAFTTF